MLVFPQLFNTTEFKTMCSSISYANEMVMCEPNLDSKKNNLKSCYNFKLIPDYITLNLKNTHYKQVKIKQQNLGYAVALDGCNAIEDYMQKQFNSKKRNILNRFVKRLEHCFPITYQMHLGNLNKEVYDNLMEALHQMILQRFDERNETHKNLKEWDSLVKNTYQKIILNQASLFVIYNQDKPIEISLNYHFNNILFSYISSYDIDYSKFGLGHVEIYKQLEWCIKNGYVLFEMGVGGLDYKRRWSNKIYHYNQYIIYHSNKLTAFVLGNYQITFYRIKEFLKLKGVNQLGQILNNIMVRTPRKYKSYEPLNLEPLTALNCLQQPWIEINCSASPFQVINRYRNDFLYTSLEQAKATKVYQIPNGNYVIMGLKHIQTIKKINTTKNRLKMSTDKMV